MRIHLETLTGRAFFLATGLIIASSAHAAGLLEVKQTVFGMDCSPCAHGVEKGLEKLEGVEDATVSLNDGYAAVTLAPDNAVTLDKIRQVVRENGFTPKDATVVVTGTLAHADDDQLTLTTATDHEYALSAAPGEVAAWKQVESLPSGTRVEIKAHLNEGETRELSVLRVKPKSESASDMARHDGSL